MIATSVWKKSEVRGLVQQMADDPDAKLWSESNLDLLIGLVHDSKWVDMLNFNNRLTSKLETLTPTSPGYILLTSAAERFHRVQSVVRDGQQYMPTDPRFVTMEDDAVVSGPSNKFYIRGERLYLFPLAVTDVELRYSYIPKNFNLLAADTTVVFWPAGHEFALIAEAAAIAMTKGAREDPSALLTLANAYTQRLMAHIERGTLMPVTPVFADEGYDWGGVND